MVPRSTPVALVALVATLALGLVGCSSAPTAPSPVAPAVLPAGEASPAAAVERPTPSAVTSPTRAPTASPDSGNVDAPVTPGLSVEPVGASTIRVTLADPAAKAWRLTVSGAGAGSADSWSLTVETGDVAPVITTIDTMGGVAGEPREQTGLEAGVTTGRVCSVSVAACIRAASVALPQDGNGTLVLEIGRTDATDALSVTGATAAWPAAPFVLGPWTTTSAFVWGS